ncbi:MAG: BspA family leucine-rich repeat surface protein, partial [Streptococcus gallolyticus]|nr:BspA family leucine-rich repeat surface protein [Streptococcus gallolyticus]
NLDTSEITTMSYMFYYFGANVQAPINLDFSKMQWNTEKVATMSCMFDSFAQHDHEHSVTLNLKGLNTANVTDMSNMFNGAAQNSAIPPTIDVSELDTHNVTNMKYMFCCIAYSSPNPITLNLSNFDTKQVADMSSMFEGICSAAPGHATVYASNKFDVSEVSKSSDMFSNAKIKGGAGTRTTEFEEQTGILGACIDQQGGTVWGVNKGFFTAPDIAYYCTSDVEGTEYKAHTLYFFGYPVEELETAAAESNTNVKRFYYWSKDNGGEISPAWNMQDVYLNCKNIVFDKSAQHIQPTNCYNWFGNFYNCERVINPSNLNTSRVTNMKYMFNSFAKHASISVTLDLSEWDTGNVENMESMFGFFGSECSSNVSLN